MSNEILAFRARHNLTLAETSAILGFTITTIQKWEREMARPTRKNMMVIMNRMDEYEREMKNG